MFVLQSAMIFVLQPGVHRPGWRFRWGDFLSVGVKTLSIAHAETGIKKTSHKRLVFFVVLVGTRGI